MDYYSTVFWIFVVYVTIYTTMATFFHWKNSAKQAENHLLQMQLFDLQQRSQYLQVQGAFDRRRRRRRLVEREA